MDKVIGLLILSSICLTLQAFPDAPDQLRPQAHGVTVSVAIE